MIWIRFKEPYKCYEKGDVKKAMPHFAKVLIDLGYAKRIREPRRDKMMKEPVKEKSL